LSSRPAARRSYRRFDAIRERLLTSDDIFELQDLPESLAVIGIGIIALELGQAMHRLGVRTAFFSPFDELGPLTDPEIRKIVRRDLGGELDLRTGVAMQQATAGGAGGTLRWRTRSRSARRDLRPRVGRRRAAAERRRARA
jgi:dihydrolipoamide dehydrogenase